MKATIWPGAAQGKINIPPSKSMAHRAMICAALANGNSKIAGLAYSDDILATLRCLEQLGAKIKRLPDGVEIQGIGGLAGLQQQKRKTKVDCWESGSTLRFLLPLFSLTGEEVHFIGRNRLLQRPQTVYQNIFQKQQLQFQQDANGIYIKGALQPGEYQIAGNISSQFITGLLFTLPLLQEDSCLIIQPPFESRSYVLLTLQMLQRFGVVAHWLDENTLQIPGWQQFLPNCYTVEGDYSQLAFFAALGVLQGGISCWGLQPDSLQGDRVILDILTALGGRYQVLTEAGNTGYQFFLSELQGAVIDLADCPDLGPILMALAVCCQGQTKIIHAARLRLKESDRIAAMETELKKMGVAMQSGPDEVIIHGGPLQGPQEPLCGHKDHRIVMSLAVLATLAPQPVTILQAEAVRKSYPNFFTDLQTLGVKVVLADD